MSEEMKLVPIEPTEEMLNAAYRRFREMHDAMYIGKMDIYTIYKAAVAAAPAHADEPVAPRLNVRHPDCHKAADAFWKYWRDNGDTHKHGYYESTWGAINAALKLVGVVTTPRVQACRPEDRAMLTGAAGQELVKCAIAEMSAHPSAGIRSEWIAVSERLPDFDVPVWLFQDGRVWVGCRVFEDEGWLWANAYNSEFLDSNGVWKCDAEADDDYQPTKWMPLPAPPRALGES